VGGLFCDLQKASDCVNHDILLAKMEFYAFTGIVNKLLKSYLDNRFQRVTLKDTNIKLNKVSLKWEHIKHGVPQGSILGPLLFLIYINDLTPSINKIATPILFADDTSIIILNTSPEELKCSINLVMTETSNWFQSNFLSLNCDKTHFLQFLTKNKMK
jgi:hypothetical protein